MRLSGLLVLLLALTGPQVSRAETAYHHPFTKMNVAPMGVVLVDDASNGCWTNLNETKDYASAQIDLAGIEVVEIESAKTAFQIAVNSNRTGNSYCYGSIEIRLFGPVEWDGARTVVILNKNDAVFTDAQNANTLVLDRVKDFATEFLATLPEGQ